MMLFLWDLIYSYIKVILNLELFLNIFGEDVQTTLQVYVQLYVFVYNLDSILKNNSPSVTSLWMFCIPIFLVPFIFLTLIF